MVSGRLCQRRGRARRRNAGRGYRQQAIQQVDQQQEFQTGSIVDDTRDGSGNST